MEAFRVLLHHYELIEQHELERISCNRSEAQSPAAMPYGAWEPVLVNAVRHLHSPFRFHEAVPFALSFRGW